MSFTSYQPWDMELISLINAKNGSSFARDELVFKIDEALSVEGATRVNITPAEGVAYYGDAYIVYGKRDLSKAFLGLPLRFVVNSNTTVQNVLIELATKYGVSLDLFTDFAEAELNKEINFTESGTQNVKVPVGSGSFVWSGELDLVVANDLLDLGTIIANAVLTNMSYLADVAGAHGALQLALAPTEWTGTTVADAIDALAVGATIPADVIPAILSGVQEQHDILEPDAMTSVLGVITLESKDTDNNGNTVAQFAPAFQDGWGGIARFVYTPSGDVPPPDFDGTKYIIECTGGNALIAASGTAMTVDWGDGSAPEKIAASASSPKRHSYAQPEDGQLYTMTITSDSGVWTNDVHRLYGPALVNVKSWPMEGPTAIIFCWMNSDIPNNSVNLQSVPHKLPTTAITTAMMFRNCYGFNSPNVKLWDTSNITNMRFMFAGAQVFNQDISGWNTSKVTAVDYMFNMAYVFDQPIGSWDMSACTNMEYLFQQATAFNSDISAWNVSKVTKMSYLMDAASTFNQNLSGWVVAQVASKTNYDRNATAWEASNKPAL